MNFRKILLFVVLPILLSCDKPIFDNPVDTDNTIEAPTDLQIEQLPLTSCQLTWTDNSNGEQGFRIDRKINSEEWRIGYAEVGENVNILNEINLTPTSTYYYRVYAFAGENTSLTVNGNINMAFPAPTNLSITQTSDTSCELTWDYSGFGDEEGFRIERRLSGGSWQEIAELSIDETSFEDTGLTEAETYEYKVYAYNSICHGNSVTEMIELQLIVIDIDGNVYQTVQIGSQWWMAKNLKVTHYRNGDDIPLLTSNADWTSTTNGAYCVYDNDPSNADTYGNLYNWYAVNDSRNIAPEGWHVPTDDEIKELEMALGMSQSEADNEGWRGTNEGSKLAGRADLWVNGALENDPEFGTSCFSFLPGGYRYYSSGGYSGMSTNSYLWSASENGVYAWRRKLNYYYATIYRNTNYKRYGFSVRCVRD